MSYLPPAYRGAPYRQPRPPTRKQRVTRILLLAVIGTAVLALVIIMGAAVARGSIPGG